MKLCAKILSTGIIILMLSTCFSPYERDEGNGLPNAGTPIVDSNLFVQQGSINEYRFYTNDPKYRTSEGYTLWTLFPGAGELDVRTVAARKTLGSSIAGYGAIICSGQRQVGNSTTNVFLTVMVNNNKQYAIGKVIGGSYTSLVIWTEAAGLVKGLGLWQTINISIDPVNKNRYHLSFNGIYEGSFVDEEAPACEGTGRNGYVVVIAQDDLNNSGVEVWFREE